MLDILSHLSLSSTTFNGYNTAYPQTPNPTTDSEETPPTTNQQTQEPMDPQTITADSTNGNTNGDVQSTDFEGTDTEFRVPTTSETATDLPILRPSEPTDIGLIIGIVIIVIVVIVSVVTMLVIIAVLFKRCGNNIMVLNKKRELSNPMYGIKGQ